MKNGLRQSMAWLHTWSGLLVGWVLLLVFVAGTSAYYRDEISFWMRPELHLADHPEQPQAEVVERATAYLQQHAPHSARWIITPPTPREPGLRVAWSRSEQDTAPPRPGVQRRGRFDSILLDPRNGQPLPEVRQTRGGEFLYRLHFDLHYMPPVWGRWIVGFCAMSMLVALVSGVITHRRIFKDFFTFRPRKGARSWLDAHNAVGVLALPYHLMITYTGMVTLMLMYMPWGVQANYPSKAQQAAFLAEVFPGTGGRDAKPAGQAKPLHALGPLVHQAQARWQGDPVGRVDVANPNDAAATVTMLRRWNTALNSVQPSLKFNGTNGQQLAAEGEVMGAAVQTRGVLYGLHQGRFAGPWLRGLFFLSGLAGCAMVATGLLLWAVRARERAAKRVAKGGRLGVGLWLVEGLNIAAIAGLPIALASYFWLNRLLPIHWPDRISAETNGFFWAWALASVCALAWPRRAMWRAQLRLGGGLLAAVPLLGAATGPLALPAAAAAGLWPVVGFELVCLSLGLGLLWAAQRLRPPLAKAMTLPAAESAAMPS